MENGPFIDYLPTKMVIFQFAMGYVKLPESSSRLVLVGSLAVGFSGSRIADGSSFHLFDL
jgi:5-formyltetrahydrofolate cyclo-ligase